MPLFHYTSLSTFMDHILTSGMLRSSSLSTMNDPRESHPWSMGSINLPLERFFPGYYSDETHIDCQFKFGQMVKDGFQVICFSGANYRGWDNEMMWAHYADRQRGVCLEFDEDQLVASVRENFSGLLFELQEVNYVRERKEKPWINWNERLSVAENFNNYLAIICREVVFHKSQFWEREDEKRLLFLNHAESLLLPFGDALKAVHIGLGIPKPAHETIFTAVNTKGLKLYVMVYERDKYQRWLLTKKEQRWWISKEDES